MSESFQTGLPPGIRLVCRRAGAEPIELHIQAADANQLAWKIHDLIPLIQAGKLAGLIEQARRTRDDPCPMTNDPKKAQ